MKLAVIYYSVTHNTSAMAEYVVQGMNSVEGVQARAFSIDAADADFIRGCAGIVFGSPTYAGAPSAEFCAFREKDAKKFAPGGKLGGAFATEQYIHGGATNAILDILRHLLVLGMMVYSSGSACGKPVIHYGPVQVSPDTRGYRDLFITYGVRFARQALKAAGQTAAAQPDSGGCVLEPAGPGDISAVFALYEKRVRWMNEKGIRQWNVTDYLRAYPADYYEQQRKSGNLWVMRCGGTAAGAVVLKQEDGRWPDRAGSAAFYLHNLVTDPAFPGLGARIIREVEKLAAGKGKSFVRLDCAEDSSFLNSYYESLGYRPAGFCRDGAYKGIRREKAVQTGGVR